MSRGPSAQHRNRSQSAPRDVSMPDPCEVVKIINNTKPGVMTLRELRNVLYPNVNPSSNKQFQKLWQMLIRNDNNFIVVDSEEDLSGNERVWVRTTLGLCKIHCRRNGECEGDCGALHVCRTFLLLSQEACPFNSKKKKCMFGHKFRTTHNSQLLKRHNLTHLDEHEMRKLFRRRPSRTSTTMPQVCIYYNKAEGKMCANEKCRSLHLCSDFIHNCCSAGNCSRNHSLDSKQVQPILDLFAIDKSWSDNMVLEDLRNFMPSRHRKSSSNTYTSDEESEASESSESLHLRHRSGSTDLDHATGGSPLLSVGERDGRVPYSQLRNDTPNSQIASCGRCESLEKELKKMQLNVSWLMTQVQDLKKTVEELRMASVSGGPVARAAGMNTSGDYHDKTWLEQLREHSRISPDRINEENTISGADADLLPGENNTKHYQQNSKMRVAEDSSKSPIGDENGEAFDRGGVAKNLQPSTPHNRYGLSRKPVQETSKGEPSIVQQCAAPPANKPRYVIIDSDEDTD